MLWGGGVFALIFLGLALYALITWAGPVPGGANRSFRDLTDRETLVFVVVIPTVLIAAGTLPWLAIGIARWKSMLVSAGLHLSTLLLSVLAQNVGVFLGLSFIGWVLIPGVVYWHREGGRIPPWVPKALLISLALSAITFTCIAVDGR
jgi:hypothetical protein